MSDKLYVITFHVEDFQDTYSKRTIIKKAKSLDELLDEIEKSWREVNPNIRIIVDFIFSEPTPNEVK